MMRKREREGQVRKENYFLSNKQVGKEKKIKQKMVVVGRCCQNISVGGKKKEKRGKELLPTLPNHIKQNSV